MTKTKGPDFRSRTGRRAGSRLEATIRCAAFLAFVASACVTREAPPAPPGPAPRGRGLVHVEAIPDLHAKKPRLEASQELDRPVMGEENRLPTYPPVLLGAALPPHAVALRFVVGTDGCVGGISPSPLAETTIGPETGLFVAAAEEAVRSWRYRPGAIRTFGPGPDLDGDGRPDWSVLESTTPAPFFFDVVFVFEVVDGRAVVRDR